MRIIDRLDKYMVYSNLNDNKVTVSCGLSVGLLGKARSGKSDLGKAAIKKVLTTYQDLDEIWLITGHGEMLNDSERRAGGLPTINYERQGVPYYNVDFLCGFDLMVNDKTINPEYYIDFKQYSKADFWVNASGDSMRPIISSGDILAVRQLPDSEWERHVLYGETYAIVLKESRTIKKIRKSRKGDEYILLVPENTAEFDEQDIFRNDVQRVFQVLGCMKKMM